MSVRIRTSSLLGLLSDLLQTADPDPDAFAFRAARGRDSEDIHAVDIRVSAGEVEIREDPNLIDEGVSLSFGELDASRFPAPGIYRLLAEMPDGVVEREGTLIPALPAAHHRPGNLIPFCRVAKRRKELIRFYRVHQLRPQLVQIGPAYRGVMGAVAPEITFDPSQPDAGLYPPDLTDARWKTSPADEHREDQHEVDIDSLFADDDGGDPAGA